MHRRYQMTSMVETWNNRLRSFWLPNICFQSSLTLSQLWNSKARLGVGVLSSFPVVINDCAVWWAATIPRYVASWWLGGYSPKHEEVGGRRAGFFFKCKNYVWLAVCYPSHILCTEAVCLPPLPMLELTAISYKFAFALRSVTVPGSSCRPVIPGMGWKSS